MRPICRVGLQTVFKSTPRCQPWPTLFKLPIVADRSHKSPFSRQFSTSLLRSQDSATKSASSSQSPPSTPKAENAAAPPQPNKKNQKEKDRRKEDDDGFNNQIDNAIGEARELQTRTPWHREGSDDPPVKRARSAGAMTKGKLLTTPSRLLKLILPLTTLDKNSDRKDIEPLALLVHPQQPLSYLERLIQSEIPLIKGKDGKEKIPEVFFRAEDGDKEDEGEEGEGHGDLVERYSGKGHEHSSPKSTSHDSDDANSSQKSAKENFIRWSSSTEVGDFIRDAARGKEFAVNIEGAGEEILVGVPSFNDRTFYLRSRLRRVSGNIKGMVSVKEECDRLAHRSAQRIAMCGFGVLSAWWVGICYVTFWTSYGWDTMEPITYLAGLSTIMLGYLWFLYHNREVSYRAALNLTVSRRQNILYQEKGFDVRKWEGLIEEGNGLRREIQVVAREYDVEWDERGDEGDEKVSRVLRRERRKDKGKEEEEEEDVRDEEEEREEKGNEKKKEGEKKK